MPMRARSIPQLAPWALVALLGYLLLLSQRQRFEFPSEARSSLASVDYGDQVAIPGVGRSAELTSAVEMVGGCYEAAPEHEYELFTGADVDGNDLLSVKNHRDIAAMKRMCNQLPDCKGFNTNGWFKSFSARRVAGGADLYVKKNVEGPSRLSNGSLAAETVIRRLEFAQMQRLFRVYTYQTNVGVGMPTPQDYKYRAEAVFPANLQRSVYATNDPEQADLFYVPIRCTAYRYSVGDRDRGQEVAERTTATMVAEVMQKYPYWNRTRGADHFYVRCHHASPTMPRTFQRGPRS